MFLVTLTREVSPRLRHALYSAVAPGLGQLAQQRPGAAAVQFATVAAYVGAAYAAGGGRAFWLALLWNTWSVVDAYWLAPRER